MSTSTPGDLHERLAQVTLRDRRRIEQRLRAKKDVTRELSAAEQRVAGRRAAVPKITYPEHLPVAEAREQVRAQLALAFDAGQRIGDNLLQARLHQQVADGFGERTGVGGTVDATNNDDEVLVLVGASNAVNLTDGYVARVSMEFGPPKIRQSRRP